VEKRERGAKNKSGGSHTDKNARCASTKNKKGRKKQNSSRRAVKRTKNEKMGAKNKSGGSHTDKNACCASAKNKKGRKKQIAKGEKSPPKNTPKKPLQHPLKNRTDGGFRLISLFISFSALGSLSPFL
jgi:hypothetical protein